MGENHLSAGGKAWRIGKYIRLSREDGNEESESIANQRAILDERIPDFFAEEYEVVGEYIDDGRSGTSDAARPDFQRLVADVKRGRINCIITKNLSRAFRNSANQGRFLEEFIPLYHTRFISLYEPQIDTFLQPEIVHSLEVSITGLLNEQYAYKTSMDIRRTFDMKRRKGEFIGAFAPYGYRKNPENRNALLIDAEAAEVVRLIFGWFTEEGMSKGGIARRLNACGIENPTAYKRKKGLRYMNPQKEKNDGLWCEKTVGRILSNAVYIGTMVQGRQKIISYKVHRAVRQEEKDWFIVPQTHEAIISEEIFQKAQQRRQSRTAPGGDALHLFAGFLKCADCKKHMTRNAAKGYAYYSCSTYKKKSKTHCTKHSIREDILQEAVFAAMRRQIEAAADWEELARAPQAMAAAELERRMAEQERELEKWEALTDALYLDWRLGRLNEAEYTRLRERQKAQAARLRAGIAGLAAERERLAAAPAAEFQSERGLLAALVACIYVQEGGGLTICFRFPKPQGEEGG